MTSSGLTIPQEVTLHGETLTVRSLTSQDDVTDVWKLMLSVGWTYPRGDVQQCLNHNPGTMLGLFNKNGVMICTATITIFSDTDAYWGFWITRLELQGRGYGRILFRATMDLVGERNLMIHASQAMTPTYIRKGFSTTGFTLFAYKTSLKHFKSSHQVPEGVRVADLTGEVVDAVATYYQSIFKLERRVMLNEWISQTDNQCFVAQDCSGSVVGFAAVRSNGHLLMLCAEELPIAQCLFGRCVEALENVEPAAFLNVYTPECNAQHVENVVGEYVEGRLEPVRKSNRMETKPREPAIEWNRVFAFRYHTWFTKH